MEINRNKMDQLISATRSLVDKIQGNENVVTGLMRQCESLQAAVRSIKEYQGSLQALGQFSGNRRQLVEIEGAYVQQLQTENTELKALLEEHQSALEMIMSKYRTQMQTLMATRLGDVTADGGLLEEELEQKTLQLHLVAQTIQKALDIEEDQTFCLQRRLAQLDFENKHLRELLLLASEASVEPSLFENSQNTVATPEPNLIAAAPKSPTLNSSSPVENDLHGKQQFYRTLYGGPHDTVPIIHSRTGDTPINYSSQQQQPPMENNMPNSFSPNIILPPDVLETDNDLEPSLPQVENDLADSFDSGASTPLPMEDNSTIPANRTDEFAYR